MANLEEKKQVLIVVRTYPTPAKKNIEVSCTAGITDNGSWIRLFPVPFRFLEQNQKFRRYQWIEVVGQKSSDSRPESYKKNSDSIKIISGPLPTNGEWKARKDKIFPLKSKSLCALQRQQSTHGYPTLGFFRPQTIKTLHIDNADPEWTPEQLSALRQIDLFRNAPKAELEKVPHTFLYEFSCNEEECRGHKLSCTDWEMAQAWRRWKNDYGANWEEKFRQKFEEEMINRFDTHFFVGTVRAHPKNWIIIGLFYPPRSHSPKTLSLFD